MPDHLKEMESLEHAVTIESLMMDMQDLGEASSLCRFYLEKCSRVHSHCPSPQYVSISESSDSENLLIVSKVFFDNG